MSWLDLRLSDLSKWNHFWSGTKQGDGPLERRWWRARAAGATAEGPDTPPIHTHNTLRVHQERSEPLLRILNEVLTPTLHLFDRHDFSLLFADRDGMVLQRDAGGSFADEAHRVRLQPGAVWDEATRGTNAIGTAIAEQRPVVVSGPAHLARPNHALVCYGVPVRDPWGEVVGVLDATSFLHRANPMAGAAVISTAKALEEALRLSMMDGAGGTLIHRLLGRLRDPALLVGPDHRIHAANTAAVASGLALGPSRSSPDGVLRVRAKVSAVLGVDTDQLRAIARGQLRVPGIEVEPVESSDGRVISWLVVLTSPVRQAPRRALPVTDAFSGLVGTDPALAAVRAHAGQVAPSTLPVLILGETGTGKELLARGIHAASDRAALPFVPVNCAALSPSLLHSELFGYADGAFTGAAKGGREGRIANAHGGTLFLDELGEMPGELQSLLLRFLEDGLYYRVGEHQPRSASVRLICATSRDLEALVADRTFRADLFYRIRGATLTLPPVRSRRDRPLLCRVLLARLCDEIGQRTVPELSTAARTHIEAAPWPGNVRELRMTLHHALVMSRGESTIEAWHLAIPGRPTTPAPTPQVEAPSLVEAKVLALQRALSEAKGNVGEAARALGVARSTVYRLMRRHGLLAEEP
jgi:transcriptional regulator of acetoin/glycerol metabolism